ncbi:uncharacterized protein PRCAT00003057001 [Priceomyces carsonii]|uniref:uncharacterized protein n=1 Tax=Priceomyces carsonii TaxID=28549 RepID=UPI002ED92187|nr:unnamed protein product [Priceomyces carsonii]
MLIDDESLYLYNLTLKCPTLTVGSTVGRFMGQKKSQEIVFASSSFLELWKPDPSTGKLQKICQQNTFAIIQCIDKISDFGSLRDFLVVTSDSGKLVLLSFDSEKQFFIPIIQEPHSKNGLRRTSPGEYLAVDPLGRTIMLGSIEKNKLMYKVQANDDNKLELSSPLEAIERHTLTLKMTALETDFEDPLFVAIECDYSKYSETSQYDPEKSSLLLNYYKFDQGLNHIVKEKREDIPGSSNELIALPAHIGGVLITCNSFLIYDCPTKERKYLPLPIRSESRETIIVKGVVHKLKNKNFFVLLQSSLGDLFKLTVVFNNELETIEDILITYFDTIPLSSDLHIFKSGFLFADVINDNKLFYQFEKLGDDENETTLHFVPEYGSLEAISDSSKIFDVKGLENLALVDILETIDPIIDSSFIESSTSKSEAFKQLLLLSSKCSLSSITHGIPTSTIVSSPLPFKPTDLLTTKVYADSKNDDYLIISSTLAYKTLVLSIGEVVEEVMDSKFVDNEPTIAVQQVGRSSVVQVYTNGVRHIKHNSMDEGEKDKKVTDWYPPAGIKILHACSNNGQILIALSNREICYFAVDPVDDQLIEYQDKLEMSGAITALAVFNDQKLSSFAIIGCSDETIQVISLQQHNCLEIISFQVLSAPSTSIIMMPDQNSTSVLIGMQNGLFVRTSLDEFSGKLSDTRVRYLGTRPVKLSLVKTPVGLATLALSSKPWIGYFDKGEFNLTPLLDIEIFSGASFESEDLGGTAIVGLLGLNLVIFTLGSQDETFNFNNEYHIKKIKLRYSPRKMVVDDKRKLIYVIETEFGTKSPYRASNLDALDQEDTMIDKDYYDAFGYPKALNSSSSSLQVVDFVNQDIRQSIEFSDGETAMAISLVQFSSSESYLIIGMAKKYTVLSNSFEETYFYTFMVQKNNKLQFKHKTDLDILPKVIIPFQGKVLVGMGNHLRLYDLGKKQLLRKSSSTIDHLKNIVKIVHQGGDRVVVGDSDYSTTFLKFDSKENEFIPFADDIMKRKITALATLDYDTIIGGDKFGNFFVSRLPERVSEQSNEDWIKYQEPFLNASGSRVRNLCEFFIQDVPTSLMKSQLGAGGAEVIIYTGIQGSVGALVPIATKQEIEFLSDLELSIKRYFDYNFQDFDKNNNGYNTLGKDHLKFRGYYNPVKNVIDGDLIEQFYQLPISIKIKLANELDRTPKDIERKISDLRVRSSF